METVDKVGLGVAGLIILVLGVAWIGYISNDDSLFQLGVFSVFLLSLLNGARQVGRLRNRNHS